MIQYSDTSAHTTDAVQTSSAPWAPQDNASYVITAICLARQEGGSNNACFKQTALIHKEAGVTTAVAVGTQEKLTSAGATAWAFTIQIINNELMPRVTGAAGITIDWQIDVSGFQIGPF